jgi:hypothetical protein
VPRILSPEQYAVWREHLSRHANSSRTVAQFCARERPSVTTFQVWKRRLWLIDLANHRPASSTPPAFLPVTVRVVKHPLGEPFPNMADLPNGVRLRIPTANTRLACRLVRAIARARPDSGGTR